jgi:predicted transcriptional regulator
MKSKASKLLGPLESRVMAVVWKTPGPVTVRDVVEALNDPRPAYTTAMTIMGRLTEKRILRRKPVGKAYAYEARLTEDEFLAHRAQRSIRRLVEDFGEVALAQFADELSRAKPGTLDRLRKLRDASEP